MGETKEFLDNSYSYSSSISLGELSRSSEGTSCSSSDLVDDASSSLTITFSSNSSVPHSSFAYSDRGGGGPLCELSELMTHLPIKRGLSRHYAGKSQSFASLASASSLEDLMKKENPCAKRMKLCWREMEGGSSPDDRSLRSFSFGPSVVAKAVTPEKRSSFLAMTTTSSSSLGKRCTSINSRPPIPVVRTF